MAMYQNPQRVCVEFLKSSAGLGKGRLIKLNYSPQQIPPQLYGRLDERLWGDFMNDLSNLAQHHPYTASPGAKQCCEWGFCGIFGAIFGFCMVQPDSGQYPTWLAEVQQLVDRWQGHFQQRGVTLSLQVTRLIWIQMDVAFEQPAATGYPVGKT